MHIKLLYRKVLYVFLSVMIVVSSTQSAYAASPSGWVVSPADVIMNGATATITAIKGAGSSALQSTVKHAPTVGNIGKNILQGGGYAAVGYAVYQIAGKAVDWVLDPANNRIKIIGGSDTNDPSICTSYKGVGGNEFVASSPVSACQGQLGTGWWGSVTATAAGKNSSGILTWNCGGSNAPPDRILSTVQCVGTPTVQPDTYIPIPTVASKIQSNANAGHSPSQEFIKTVVIDDVNTGAVDVPLNMNAIPVADAPPVNPPYDPTQPSPPFDPSSIISAIKSVMAAIVNMAGVLGAKIDALMVEMGLQNAKTIEAISSGTQEIVAANDRTGAQVAAIAAAIADIEGNTLDGKVINDAVDRAIAAGHTDTASIVAAIEAIEGNTLDGKVINDAVDRVIANDNVNAQSAADAANTAAEAAKAADAANTAAVTDAIGAQTDAITQADPVTGETSLKLPSFCGWAGTVCDYMDWVKGEYQTVSDFVKTEPETMPDEPVVVADDPSSLGDRFRDQANAGYVSFQSQCPDNVLIPVSLMGASQSLNISYAPFCHFASLIRPAVILGAWISGLLIISGGRARE